MKKYLMILISVVLLMVLFGCPTDLPIDDAAATYLITITPSDAASGESVSVDIATAEENAKVIVTANLHSERMVTFSADGITFTPSTIYTDEGITTFVMPAVDIVISATFSDIPPTLYTVNISSSGIFPGESITADISSARAGTTITLTANLNIDRQVKLSSDNSIIACSNISVDNETTSFTIPTNDVSISAEFSFLPQIIHASDLAQSDTFGKTVNISGDYAIIGAPEEDGGDNSPASKAGAAYIFKNDGSGNWTEIDTLHASDMLTFDAFGSSVGISGDYAIIGAPEEDGGINNPASYDNQGAAYIFKNDGSDNWTEIAILHASDMSMGDVFGISVGISGTSVIIGAQYEDGGSDNLLLEAGAAYIINNISY